MTGYTDKLRAVARRLLSEGQVDVFIGYREGSRPLVHHPVVITRAAQADTLVWDAHCALNLANYVVGRPERVGIVATGCVSRNLVPLIQEHQIARERLYIVGVPCTGMLDRSAILQRFADREVTGVTQAGDRLAIELADGREELAAGEFRARNCRTCAHPNPVI
ncbi:MAG: 4Fe-4S ferredoxin, partial [Candidatus Eisenbacteria bacterium]